MSVRAQPNPPTGPADAAAIVSQTGTHVIEKNSEFMRMHVDLQAKGDSLETALAALRERVQAARARLGELRADKDSITVGDPQISQGKTDQQRQMEAMMQRQLRSQGRSKPASDAPTPVRVTAELTAQWTLDPGTPEELLLAVHPLQEKIRQADVGGTKQATELSPEERELQEELGDQNVADYYGSDGEPKPGEPDFVFVSYISDDEYDAALAKAFQNARDQAGRLAKAADAQLGAIRSIGDVGSSGLDWEMYGGYDRYSYNARSYQMMQRIQARARSTEKATEAIGPAPGKIKYNVAVSASFNLTAK